MRILDLKRIHTKWIMPRRYRLMILVVGLLILILARYVHLNGQKPDCAPTAYLKSSSTTVTENEASACATADSEPEYYEVEATAYCSCAKCCGKQTGVTATGDTAVEGTTIAADWDVFPPYTRLEIEGLGRRIVHDKGGAIKGMHIDIYFDSHEDALAFGKQTLWVRIIKED